MDSRFEAQEDFCLIHVYELRALNEVSKPALSGIAEDNIIHLLPGSGCKVRFHLLISQSTFYIPVEGIESECFVDIIGYGRCCPVIDQV